MKIKFIGIFLLALLLILGLLQIEAIGNLNPIFHSIAVSLTINGMIEGSPTLSIKVKNPHIEFKGGAHCIEKLSRQN